jgi:trehalose 6-phosphate phosphatase
MKNTPNWVTRRISESQGLRIFLDYDGTLAEFAPTPQHVLPDPEIIGLIESFTNLANVSVAIISGRRLDHIQKLVPIRGVLLAGTYGVEMVAPNGEKIRRLKYNTIRPILEEIKPEWESVIAGEENFFLEDKGWSLALHARFVEDILAEQILTAAHSIAEEYIQQSPFQILGGNKFLEVGPTIADKGQTIEYLLNRIPNMEKLLVYMGDDDKDELAFKVVNANEGISVLVSSNERETNAHFRLQSPMEARQWLRDLYQLIVDSLT